MINNHAESQTSASSVTLEVPAALLGHLPPEVRHDPVQRDRCLLIALEIGLKAMAQAGVHLDTEVVKAEFHQFQEKITGMRGDLEKLMQQELTDEDSRLARSLKDYLAEEGKLSRMMQQFHSELSDPEREKSIPGGVRKILDEHFRDADSPFQRALSMTDDRSPLKKFVQDQDQKVSKFQEELAKKHTKLAESIEAQFEKVFDHLGYKQQLKAAEDAGTQKGGVFEDELVEVLGGLKIDKDHIERVGEETVDGTRVKRGDLTIDVEHQDIGSARIVIEAKAGKYSLGGKDGVLKQLDDAMDYRQADAGIVVVTKDYAGKRQQLFDRRGTDRIVVVVDPEDDRNGFLPLEVAYIVLREHVLAKQSEQQTAGIDTQLLERSVGRIEQSMGHFQSMRKHCTEVEKSVDSVRGSLKELENCLKYELDSIRHEVAGTST